MSRTCREIERKVLRLLHGHETRTQLRQIHAHFLRHGLGQINQILAHFVSVCGSLNRMLYANRIFNQTQNPNIFLFNAMIKGYSICGPFEESFHLFTLMKSRGIWPDEYTFAPLLKAYSSFGDFKLGQCAHKEVIVAGFECFNSVRIGVVEFYANSGVMGDAKQVFDEMRRRDVIVWNLMVQGYCKTGDFSMGLSLFREMSERSIVSWNIMISCLARSGRHGEALGLFQEMRDHGFKPDECTLVTVLPICSRLGTVDVAEWIRSYAESEGLSREFVSVGNALIDFYCKCGNMETARQIFDEIPQKNVVSWNTMISGMAYNGKGVVGIDLFEEMISKGMKPNDATFIGVLSCCSHAGLVDRGRNLFSSMTADHQIEPKLEHYGCMVDLLGRSGFVREAYDMIRGMHGPPNAVLWGALLGACRTHCAVDLAELALKELIVVEPQNSGNYVLLSNIYADDGRWDKVEEIRVMMRQRSIKKAPGQSSFG